MKIIAAIGDIHACHKELKELYDKLSWMSLDEIWCLGDLVDRGPDSGAVISFLRENKIPSIMGNHDQGVARHWRRVDKGGHQPKNPEKVISVLQLCKEDVEYIEACPLMHVFDKEKLILVHGGLWPGRALHNQPHNIIRAAMIHTEHVGKSRWWGPKADHKSGKIEADSYADGWRRWYQIYDFHYDVAYGHHTWPQGMIHRNPGCGYTVGCDTGAVFGGSLTAAIFGKGDPFFVSVQAKEEYTEDIFKKYDRG